MKPFITSATRTKCSECGGARFEKKRSREFDNEIPICISCKGRPALFRVGFVIPNIGGKGFKKIYKTTDEKGRKLDTPSRADAFCEYIKEKISLKENDFDPRELGSKEEKNFFLIKNNGPAYYKNQLERFEAGEITPGGIAKKERVMRLYITPLFGEYSIRELSYQLIDKTLSKKLIPGTKRKFTDSMKAETITELSVFFKWCCKEALLKTSYQLPEKPPANEFEPEDLYSIVERDMVINNIRNVKARIGCAMLAVYVRRKCEIEQLTWGAFDFRNEKILFKDHVSNGKGIVPTRKVKGLKSSPKKIVRFKFFPGLRAMLMQLNPSLDPNEYVFKGKKPGKPVHGNFFYEYWKDSALELIDQGKLTKYCDLHRGTRSSTVTALREEGHHSSAISQLYAGDEKTMEKIYIKQSIQNTDGILTSEGLVN